MKARRRIDGASFGPDALKAMGQAFDAAWEHVRESFGADPLIIEAARLALADALLSVASDGSRDVGVSSSYFPKVESAKNLRPAGENARLTALSAGRRAPKDRG